MTNLNQTQPNTTSLPIAWQDEPAVNIPLQVQVLPHAQPGLDATLHLLLPDSAPAVRTRGDTTILPRGA